MDLLNAILQTKNGAAVDQLGQNFGLNQDQTQMAISALLPALARGLQQNTTRPGGLEALLSALSDGDHDRYLEQPEWFQREEAQQEGNGILGHIFGTKEVSRAVAGRASERTGLSQDLLKQMLPFVATLAMGALSRRQQHSRAAVAGAPGGGGILQMLTPMLDQNQDGSVFDDLLGMAGRYFSQPPR